jgi:ABC-type multidrug transport system ATPase subunit
MKLLFIIFLSIVNLSKSCQDGYKLIKGICYKCVLGEYCVNNTSIICKSGYYCPDTTIMKGCYKSNFCPTGTNKQFQCLGGTISCPENYMEKQNIILPIFFLIILIYFSICIIRNILFQINKTSQIKYQKKLDNKKYIINNFYPLKKYVNRWRKQRYNDENSYLINEDNRYYIKFRNLDLSINNKKIITNISGKIEIGKINVIIGESGCGKSSFIKILLGQKINYNSANGKLEFMNEKISSLRNKFLGNIGWVQQHDILYNNLTVEENIYYNSRLFNDDNVNINKINELLRILEIDHIRYCKIGSYYNNKISGGERKRVSLAMELAKNPKMLILDEPTSGIDSSTSLKIFRILNNYAKLGNTVIVTIHQPREKLFTYFDNILLMVDHGNLIYCDKKERIRQYFKDIGYCMYDKTNLLNSLSDITTSSIKPNINNLKSKNEILKYIINKWNNRLENNYYNDITIRGSKKMLYNSFKRIIKTYYLILERSLIIILRSKFFIFTNFIFTILTGIFIGNIFSSQSIILQFNSSILIMTLITTSIGLKTFGNDKIIIQYEIFSNINTFINCFAKYTAYFILEIFICLTYSFSWLHTVQIRSSFTNIFLSFLLVIWTIGSLANFISVIVDSKNSSQIAYSITVSLWVLNGINPTINQLMNKFDSTLIINLLTLITPIDDILKICMIQELIIYPELFNSYKNEIKELYNINYNEINKYKINLIFYGLFFKILTILVIIVKYKLIKYYSLK